MRSLTDLLMDNPRSLIYGLLLSLMSALATLPASAALPNDVLVVGQIAEPKPDSWYDEVARSVYRPDIYLEAARMLVEEGHVDGADFPWDSDGYRAPQSEFIDAITFDGRQPNDYLLQFPIGLKGREMVAGNQVVGG